MKLHTTLFLITWTLTLGVLVWGVDRLFALKEVCPAVVWP